MSANMNTEHTPLPWFTGYSENGDLPDGTLIIAGDEKYRQTNLQYDGNVICAVAPPYNITEQDCANAEYIVEACNNYERLKEALEEIRATGGSSVISKAHFENLKTAEEALNSIK